MDDDMAKELYLVLTVWVFINPARTMYCSKILYMELRALFWQTCELRNKKDVIRLETLTDPCIKIDTDIKQTFCYVVSKLTG